VDCGIESLYRVICSVQSGSSWLRPVVMGSFHWLSWMDPHLCRAGHTAYFLSGGEGGKKIVIKNKFLTKIKVSTA